MAFDARLSSLSPYLALRPAREADDEPLILAEGRAEADGALVGHFKSLVKRIQMHVVRPSSGLAGEKRN